VSLNEKQEVVSNGHLQLPRQVHEYERLRAGEVKARNLRSLTDLPRALIEARTAGHVTQKELADRLELAEQQIQRWEATNYAGVGVERMQNIADALGARITEKISFSPPARAPRRACGTAEAGRNDDIAPAKRVRSAD
jgi:transcriptional regulator with XRE-family HTH domain